MPGKFSAAIMDFMEEFRHVEILIEATLSLPAFVLNVYSIVKLRQLDALFPNLRIVMITSCAATALLSILHPIQHLIPPLMYSVTEGRYWEASLYYTICFVSHVCFMLFEYKYLFIAYERHIAMRYRHVYEHAGNKVGARISVVYLLSAIFVTIVKIAIYLFDDTEQDIDKILHRAFFVEGPAGFFISCYFVSLGAWFLSVWEIHHFSKAAEQTRRQCQTLTESFQMRQIILVLELLKPLALVFFLGALFTGACLAFLVVVLWHGYNEHNPSYKAAANAVYIAIAAYNLFATIYLIFYFEPMRKLMRRDLNKFFGIDVLSTTAKCAPLKSAADIQTEHFERLQVIWSTSIRPRSA